MPVPLVVRTMQQFRAGLLRREAGQMREMARRWLEVERRLQGRMEALAEQIALDRAAGQTVTQAQVYQMQRYQALMAQVRAEVDQYQAWAQGRVTSWQGEAGQLGVTQAQEAIRAAGLRGTFTRLPVTATEYMAGLTADGGPLFDLLRGRALWPEAVDGLTRVLVDAVAMGWGPRKAASRMADGLAAGLQKALVIARSEQLRVYRAAAAQQYRDSGVVRAMKRMAAKDQRTCLACLAMDGEIIPLDREMYDHPCGRCTAAPVIIGAPEPQWETGAEWFKGLDPSTQRDMMGDRLYELWARGKGFEFADLARLTHSDVWGDGLRVATLEELAAQATLSKAA